MDIFKVIVSENELQKLLSVFNKKFGSIQYQLSSREDSQCTFMVKHDNLNEEELSELYEILMEDFDTIQIEEIVGNQIKRIGRIYIRPNGGCFIYDKDNELIQELSGDWKEKCSVVLALADSDTKFEDVRSGI